MSTRQLQTAAERRADVIAAALTAFARSGYFGANTTEIARDAGISQAYLYRLYDSKEALFVATMLAAKDILVARINWLVARAPDGEPVGVALQRAATEVPPESDTEAATVMLHAAAAAHVEPIGQAVRECFRSQVDTLAALGANEDEIRAYLAWSQYANVLRAAGLSQASPDARDRTLLPQTPYPAPSRCLVQSHQSAARFACPLGECSTTH